MRSICRISAQMEQEDCKCNGVRHWIPALDIRYPTRKALLLDAWEVFRGRAVAVKWPERNHHHGG